MISPVRWVVKLSSRYFCYIDTEDDEEGSRAFWCAERCPYEVRFFRSLSSARHACRRVRRIEKRRGRDPKLVRVVALWPKSMPVEHRKVVRGVLRLLAEGKPWIVGSLGFQVRELGGGE